MLILDNIYAGYGKSKVLKGICLQIEMKEIVALLGANGAGKTTTIMSISGLIQIFEGSITLNGERLDRLSPVEIVKRGVVQVPEGRRIFPRLTVLENLEMGAFLRRDKKEIQEDLERVFQQFPILKERRNQHGGTLSGGEQQMLALGRALMSRPQVLLLDEPSLGLSPILVESIFQIIQMINESGTTILLVEQNARMALSISKRGYVIESGAIKFIGTSTELLENPQVKEAYLGA